MDAPTAGPDGFEIQVASGARGNIAKRVLLTSTSLQRYTDALTRLLNSLEI